MVNCVSLVYFSATKTTQKNLRTIAEGIGLPVKEYDFTLPQNRSADIAFGPDELVLAGAPVYGGVMPLLEREYLEQHVSGQNTPCVVVAVYGNRAYDDCLVEMEDLMTEKGFAVIAAAACIGEHSLTSEIATGRPDESDLAKSKAFGKQLAEKLQKGVSPLPKGTIPGNRPYRERGASNPMGPENVNGCTHCGLCVRNCPVGAIDAEDPGKVDASKCLRCLACVRLCPIHSKQFTSDAYKGSVAWCLSTFKEPRKEPEFYL